MPRVLRLQQVQMGDALCCTSHSKPCLTLCSSGHQPRSCLGVLWTCTASPLNAVNRMKKSLRRHSITMGTSVPRSSLASCSGPTRASKCVCVVGRRGHKQCELQRDWRALPDSWLGRCRSSSHHPGLWQGTPQPVACSGASPEPHTGCGRA